MATKPSSVEKLQDTEDLELYEQLKELGGGATIQVYREPNREFLATVEPDAVELESLKEQFGGGSFSLRARRDGTWIKGVSMVRVRIAGAPKPGSPGQALAVVPGAAVTPAEVVHPPGTIEARLAALEGPPVAAESSTAVMINMMTTLLVPVLTTALQRQPENTALEIFEIARKFAKETRKDAPPPESDVVRDLGLPLLDVIQRGLPGQTTHRPALPPPQEETASVTPGKPVPTPQELAARIAAWCEPLERRNADPAMRAWCFLEDMADSPLLDATMDLVRLPNVLDLWGATSPRVSDNRGWYASFVDELRRLTDDADDVDSEGNQGDAVHAPSNGQAVEAGKPDAGDIGAGA